MENKKLKVMICSNVYPPNFIGGAELIAHYQAKEIQKLGHDVVVFTGDIKQQGERHSLRKETFEGLTINRIQLQSEDYQNDYVNFSHPTVENHFRIVLKEFKPDIVHFHNIIGLSVGIVHIAKMHGAKTFMTLHDHWGFCHRNTIINTNDEICTNFSACANCLSFIQDGNQKNIPIKMRKDYLNLILKHIDYFISPSSYLAETYIKAGFPKKKFNVVWNGLDVKKFASITKKRSDNYINLTFVGHFGLHKGVQVLLNALPLLNNKGKLKVNLVGEGEQRSYYEEIVKKYNLEKLVRFWGKVENSKIDQVYKETDVLILPSIWKENQPVSITEAMSCGIPVIASNMGGIPELVRHEETGLLFESGNSSDLARQIDKLLKDENIIEELGKNAYRLMSTNTFENQVNKIINLYYNSFDSTYVSESENINEIIVLVGNKVIEEFVYTFRTSKTINNYNVVFAHWLEPDQLIKAKAFVVVDSFNWLEYVIVALKNKIPLIVPEENIELKNLCLEANCGLYYSNETEANLCFDYLMMNDVIRSQLGENGYEYFMKKTVYFPNGG